MAASTAGSVDALTLIVALQSSFVFWGTQMVGTRAFLISLAGCALLSLAAVAQQSPESRVAAAISRAGYSDCPPPDFDNFFGTPDGAKLTKPERITLDAQKDTGTYRLCQKGNTTEIWQIAPTIGGPGINRERFVMVHGRYDYGTGQMWVVPNQAYKAHNLYFPGRTTKSARIFDPLNTFEEWKDIGATLPFVPGRVMYFGNARGVAYIGFTDLSPLPGMQKLMAPLTRSSVVVGVDGYQFRTSQSYVRYFNTRLNGQYPQNNSWEGAERHVEVAFYPSPDSVNDLETMHATARIAYLPVYLAWNKREAWDAAVNTPGARALSLGVSGSVVTAMMGPLAGGKAILGAVGYDEDEYQRRKQECRDAGGIC